MSTAARDVLTREEVSALLESLRASRDEAEGRSRYLAEASAREAADLTQGLDRAVQAYSRNLSTRFQCRIHAEILRTEEMLLGDLQDLMGEAERLVLFDVEGSACPGAIVLNRSLFFALLTLNLGGKLTDDVPTMEDRALTAVEQRLFERFCAEALLAISQGASDPPRPVSVRSVEEARAVGAWAEHRIQMIHIRVDGLGPMSRIRVAWPLDALGGVEDQALAAAQSPTLERALAEARVTVAAEAGTASISIAGVAALRVGDVLPLDAHAEGRLSVCIEGHHKFEAIRGTVGTRAAIQIVESQNQREAHVE